MRRERQRDAFVAGEKLLVVEVRQLERLGQHDRVIGLNAVRSVYEIGRVQLQQTSREAGRSTLILWEVHDLHPQQHDRGRVVDHDVGVEHSAGLDDPQPGLELRVARSFTGEAVQKAFDVFSGDHEAPGGVRAASVADTRCLPYARRGPAVSAMSWSA